MNTQLTTIPARKLRRSGRPALIPATIAAAGERAARRFIEDFTAEIANPNTRAAYARAVLRFLEWCEDRQRPLERIDPITVAAYIRQLTAENSKPLVKQHLAAIRGLFDYLVTGGIIPFNPAAAVRGPKYKVKKGKTPVLNQEEARALLNSIDTRTIAGLRDRALIAVMIYSFGRVGAVLALRVEDYYQQGKRWWVRLHEKGGKEIAMPVHHKAEEYLDAYLRAAGIWEQKKAPLFRSIDRDRKLTNRPMRRRKVLEMIKRRSRAAGLATTTNCHTFRATGITDYMRNGGKLETAQQMAGHESSRTTGLYVRTGDEVTLDEVERIGI